MWQKIFKNVANKDIKILLIDSTAIKVHQHGARALKKEDESKLADEATGTSREGLKAKII